jgi:NAD(P)-dependent dehydrogenase (short-subunit alcohol dehydrogenase family)
MSCAYRSVFVRGLLAGNVVVVTGGGSGIGRCTAHEVAALGAAVANLTGGFLMARECVTQWTAKAGTGAIVNIIADMWGGMPGMGHAGAARAGMLNLAAAPQVLRD